MGLDMYLEAERFISNIKTENVGDEKRTNDELRKALSKVKGFEEIANMRSGDLDYIRIVVEVGYWRKANAIHNWFVENIQEGEDDCGRYLVLREELVKLRGLCEKVLKNPEKAEDLLPTRRGFFFGPVVYDKWYFGWLKQTMEIIDRALKLPKEWDIYYEASW